MTSYSVAATIRRSRGRYIAVSTRDLLVIAAMSALGMVASFLAVMGGAELVP